MWSLIEINRNPDKKELRKFGLIALVVLGAAAVILRFAFGMTDVGVLLIVGAGLCIFLISLVCAKVTRIIYLGLAFATLPIGLVISVLLMAAFYFLVLTPVGLVFKIIGRDALHRKFEPDATTYWTKRQQTDNPERYFHQS